MARNEFTGLPHPPCYLNHSYARGRISESPPIGEHFANLGLGLPCCRSGYIYGWREHRAYFEQQHCSELAGNWNKLTNEGQNSIATGTNNSISSNSLNSGIFGGSSYLIGNNTATFLMGGANESSYQTRSFAAGGSNLLWSSSQSGYGNIALGYNNQINPGGWNGTTPITNGLSYSVLIGLHNTTTQSQSWVLGMGNEGQTNTVTLGTYSQTATDAALIVGIGTSTTRSNGLVVLRDGTVQIPSGVLQLGGENALTSTSATSLISGHLSTNGYLKKAYGTNSYVSNGGLVAIGATSEATATEAFAIGDNSHAWGVRSMAVGANTIASGWRSTALGDSSRADGDSSFAIGGQTYAAGRESLAIGSMASSNAIASLAIGYMSTVTSNATGASAIGRSAYAAGENSTSLGWYTNAISLGSTALGANNLGLAVNGNSTWLWMETDPVLEVGNGDWHTRRSNAITTLKNGRTTLTNKFWNESTPTTVPTSGDAGSGNALGVEGHTELKGNAKIKGNTVLEGKVTLTQPQGDISMGIYN